MQAVVLMAFGNEHRCKQQPAEHMQFDLHQWDLDCNSNHISKTYYARMLLLYPSKTDSTQPTATSQTGSSVKKVKWALPQTGGQNIRSHGALADYDLVYQILGFE